MHKVALETKEHLQETTQLVRKTLYKTIEFQILFKIFYLSILVFVINFLVSVFFDVLDFLNTTTRLDDTIHLTALFDFQVITVLSISLFVFMYVYLIEKNGIIIITTEYYRNNFISFFKTFFLSVQKTPQFIFRRFYEMRIIIACFIGIYILWKLLALLILPKIIIDIFGWILIIYGAWIFFSILFRYTFTAYETCLHPKESYIKFNARIPKKFLRKRTHANIVFYTIFILSVFLLIILFSLVAKALLFFSNTYPQMISTLFAFFISFTIISILIVLSFMKTFKVAIMTVLYYKERTRQHKNINTLSTTKQPLLSKNLKAAFISIIAIVIIFGTVLTTTIKTKTDNIINNTSEYIKQIKSEQPITPAEIKAMKNMEPVKFIQAIINHESPTSTLGTIEKFVLIFLAYLIIK